MSPIPATYKFPRIFTRGKASAIRAAMATTECYANIALVKTAFRGHYTITVRTCIDRKVAKMHLDAAADHGWQGIAD